MRQTLIITCFFLIALPCRSQDPDSVLAHINAVKLSTDYIYGYCLHAADSVLSRQAALNDLIPHLNSYLKGQCFRFINDKDHCPDSVIQYLVYFRASDYWRTLAFVEKADLERIESRQQADFDYKGVQASFDVMKATLINATTLVEIDRQIAGSDVADRIKTGQLSFDTDQRLVNGAYLVYYEAATGIIVEIRTPRDENQQRYNARNGLPADRLVDPAPNVRWFYFDEPQPSQAR